MTREERIALIADTSSVSNAKRSRFRRGVPTSGFAADAASATKGKRGKSPLARSMELLRRLGYVVGKTEYWLTIPSGRPVRKDLFGFGDALAVLKSKENVIVQATSQTNLSHRVAKIMANPLAPIWLSVQTNRIEVHAWKKRKIKGKKIVRWEVTRREITFGVI